MAKVNQNSIRSAKPRFEVPEKVKAALYHKVETDGARKVPDGTKGIITAAHPNRYGGVSIRIKGDDGKIYYVSTLNVLKVGKKATDAQIAAIEAERESLFEETVHVIGDMDAVRQNDNSALLRIDGLLKPLWFSLEHIERHTTEKVEDGKAVYVLPVYGFKALGPLTQDALREKSGAVEKLIS